jgi:endoglucanase
MARIRPLVMAAAVAAASVLPAGCSAAHQAGAAPPGSRGPDAGIAFPLHTSGASIVDARGRRVKLSMVNWYGAESPEYVVGGLASQPISAIISRIVSMGFNGVRLPWSNQMWQADPLVSPAYLTANPQFRGERADTIFGQVVRDLARAGLMIVLDNHSSDAEWCCSATDGNALWYNSGYPQSAWLADWEAMAAQFKGTPQVIGADLRNEPRGRAAWGGPDPSVDWHAAATAAGDAVQRADPSLLIFVEGTHYGRDLAGVASLPARLTMAGHVVYEAHAYGHGYRGVASYDAWVAQIQPDWGYLVGREPLWIGEFGTCNTSDTCVSSRSPADLGLWFSVVTRYLGYHDLGWSYWAINGTQSRGLPGQGRVYRAPETYGVLDTGWDRAANASLLARLRRIQPACAPGPLASGTYYISNVHTGDVIDVPGRQTAEGTGLDQWPLHQGAGQRWKITGLGCGLYSITSVLDGESMDVAGHSTSGGAAVDQWPYRGRGNQQFVIRRDPAGSYTIASINSLDDVEVPGLSTRPGAPLDQWEPDGGANQQWTFRPAPG